MRKEGRFPRGGLDVVSAVGKGVEWGAFYFPSAWPQALPGHGLSRTSAQGVKNALWSGTRSSYTFASSRGRGPTSVPPFLGGSHALREGRAHRLSGQRVGGPARGCAIRTRGAGREGTAVRWHHGWAPSPAPARPGPPRLGDGGSERGSAHVPAGRSPGETEAAPGRRVPAHTCARAPPRRFSPRAWGAHVTGPGRSRRAGIT